MAKIANPQTDQPLPEIAAGAASIAVKCPSCGRVASFTVEIHGQLTMDETGGRLRPTLSTKSIQHDCRDDEGTDPIPGIDE